LPEKKQGKRRKAHQRENITISEAIGYKMKKCLQGIIISFCSYT
jgi:hypothetical protein